MKPCSTFWYEHMGTTIWGFCYEAVSYIVLSASVHQCISGTVVLSVLKTQYLLLLTPTLEDDYFFLRGGGHVYLNAKQNRCSEGCLIFKVQRHEKFRGEWTRHETECKSKMEQDKVFRRVSVLCWLAAPYTPNFYWK